MYQKDKFDKVFTKGSASLLCNNLSAKGKSLAYVHDSEVYVIAEGAASSGSASACKIQDKDSTPIMQAKWISLAGKDFLVLATQCSIQVWGPDGKRMYFWFPLPASDSEKYAKGITACPADDGSCDYISVGSSVGDIYVFQVKGEAFNLSSTLKEHEFGICDMACTKAEGGAGYFMASGDNNGGLVVWKSKAEGFEKVANFAGSGHWCTALAMRGCLLLSAYSSGHIKIHDVKSCSLAVQIQAHARLINALALHPTKDLFVSAAEDTCFSVWSLPSGGNNQVKQVSTIPVADSLLCGVQFCGEGNDSIAVTAYDSDHIYIWQSTEK